VLINKSLFLDAPIVLTFCSVVRADNVPSMKKNPFLKRQFFVTVSSSESETTAKTADVHLEGQIAKWNQDLEPL
jgi:hypothetical protein